MKSLRVPIGFIICFMTKYQYLHHLAGLTIKLQSKTKDIIQAYKMIGDVQNVYSSERDSVENTFNDCIFGKAVQIAEQDVAITMPWIAGRQRHRTNAPGENIKEYYLRNLAIPLLDHISNELDLQFTDASQFAYNLLCLVPAVLCSKKDVDLSSALDTCNNDLPGPEVLEREMLHWKTKHSLQENSPDTIATAIKDCDEDIFPNVFTLLKLAATLPVISCESERSAGSMRRLNTYLRASMGESRLTSLALTHVHYDAPVDLDGVVDLYLELYPRKMELSNILMDRAAAQ